MHDEIVAARHLASGRAGNTVGRKSGNQVSTRPFHPDYQYIKSHQL
jgi:hypothetical protein